MSILTGNAANVDSLGPVDGRTTWKMLALFIAVGVFFANPANVLTVDLSFSEEPIRIGITPLVAMLAGMTLGPGWGLFVGGLNDLISVYIWHGIEQFVLGFCLVAMARGFFAGYVYNFLSTRFSLRAVAASVGVSHFILGGFATPFFLYLEYGIPMADNVLLRLAAQLFSIPFYATVAFIVLKFIKDSRDLRRLNARLHHLLQTDELTGLANRRCLLEFMGERVRADGDGSTLSVIIVDLDDFKHINDRYGHQVGDAVLGAIGEFFHSQTRAEDLAGRMGGDEFMIILDDVDLCTAHRIADRLRMDISRLDIPRVCESITATLGVSQLRPGEDVDGLIARADDALYRGKHAGRNVALREEEVASI